ncbi:VOC family protein [Alkalibacterium sp. f15]|uniref:VOC family protein n=1 Tax=Alkalibacterium sp. f15 TaxID=3414029 RepID=UPI003BF7D683
MNRLNLVCIGVKDMSRALAFYKGIGFQTPETSESPPIVFFDNEGSKLELYPISELQTDIDPDDPPALSVGEFSGITFACNMKTKEDVDATMKLVEAAGGEVVKSPQTVFWGCYSGYFRDLDGYYWELAYSDDWKFDDRNMLIIETE